MNTDNRRRNEVSRNLQVPPRSKGVSYPELRTIVDIISMKDTTLNFAIKRLLLVPVTRDRNCVS